MTAKRQILDETILYRTSKLIYDESWPKRRQLCNSLTILNDCERSALCEADLSKACTFARVALVVECPRATQGGEAQYDRTRPTHSTDSPRRITVEESDSQSQTSM